MECINCGNETVGRSKYCSDRCKVMYNRNKKRNTEPENVTVNPTSVTESPQSVTDSRTLTLVMLAGLPDGVSRPTAQPTAETAGVHAVALMDSMNRYSGIGWLNSPEYAEVVYRLLTSSVEQLEAEGQFVPCWKAVA